MLRRLVVTGIVFVIGYAVGTIFGYRTAVVDYVENDAETIEQVADTMYGDDAEGMPDELREKIEEMQEEGQSADSDGDRYVQ